MPLKGHEIEIWTPAKAKLINENSVQIIEIRKIEYKNIKIKDIEQINFDQSDLENMDMNYSVGQILEIELESVFNEVILTTKS